MPDGDGVESFQSIALWQVHVDELGVHTFDVGQYEELFDGRVVTHVALELRIGIAPLLRGLAEEGYVEKIRNVSWEYANSS